MSDLRRKLQASGLPPMMPQPRADSRIPPHKRWDYSPLHWNQYFDDKKMVETTRGKFCVYSKGSTGPLVVCLHGGGFSALTWALFSKYLIEAAQCQILAIDQRGHGETITEDDADLCIQTLALDVGTVLDTIYSETEPPPIILLGHSMGGSVAVHSSQVDIVPSQIGLIVLDVVEGSAMEALNGMKSFLRSRPQKFKSLEQAIEWSVRGGQIKNRESARVSMIGQVKPCSPRKQSDDLIGSNNQAEPITSTEIKEEEEDESNQNTEIAAEQQPEQSGQREQAETSNVPQTSNAPHQWRINLEETEQFWSGWFEGLSSLFLNVAVPKVLILAGVDRLDKELAIGQMQGKFQMQIVGQAGHAVHEDAPDKVADVVATYMVRNKFTEQGQSFHRTTPTC